MLYDIARYSGKKMLKTLAWLLSFTGHPDRNWLRANGATIGGYLIDTFREQPRRDATSARTFPLDTRVYSLRSTRDTSLQFYLRSFSMARLIDHRSVTRSFLRFLRFLPTLRPLNCICSRHACLIIQRIHIVLYSHSRWKVGWWKHC